MVFMFKFNSKGVHKNHEVKTIKKAQPIIRKLLSEINEGNDNL
jgi:hypothetical protein